MPRADEAQHPAHIKLIDARPFSWPGIKVDLVPRRALKGKIGARILSEVVLI